jgi:hypothetical protein
MSGLLRRLKRSRAAGAGEVPRPDHDTVSEAAPTPPTDLEGGSTTPVTASRPSLFSDPDPPLPPPRPRPTTDDDEWEPWPGEKASSASDDAAPSLGGGPSGATPQPRRPPFPLGAPGPAASSSGGTQAGAQHPSEHPSARADTADDARTASGKTGAPLGGTPAGAPPDISRDPSVPAGLDPAEAAARPQTGRKGPLRRRLRYLRRARELMLRDLGGLVYEIHRTGGGDMPAHAGLVAAKVQRMVTLDAEAHALEAALGAPREHVMLFEPGVGGTCDVCGELYPSDARYCARCGTPTTGEPARQAEEDRTPGPASERAPTLAEPGQEPVAPLPEPPLERPAPGAEAPTSQMAAAGEHTAAMPVTDVDRVAAAADAASEEGSERRTTTEAPRAADDAPAEESSTAGDAPAGTPTAEPPSAGDHAAEEPRAGDGDTAGHTADDAAPDAGDRPAHSDNGPHSSDAAPGHPPRGEDEDADRHRERSLTPGDSLAWRERGS